MKKALVIANMLFASSTVFGIFNFGDGPGAENQSRAPFTFRAPVNSQVQVTCVDDSSTQTEIVCVEERSTQTEVSENSDNSVRDVLLSYIKSKSQATDLMLWAAKSNQSSVVDYLIGNNVDVNGTINGQNSLYQAVLNKNLELADHLILNGAKFNGNDKENLLFNAIDTNNMENVKYLIGKGVNIGYTYNGSFLDRAVSKRYFDIAKYLIENGAEVRNLQKYQVLSFVIENGSLDLVKHFISKGVDVNLADGNKRTLLHNAVLFNKYDIAEYLVNNERTIINAQDNNAYTPLLYAAEKGQTDIAELLIKKLVEKDDTGSLLNTMGNIKNVQSGFGFGPSRSDFGFGPSQSGFGFGPSQSGFGFGPSQNNSQVAQTPLYKSSQNGSSDIVKLLAENKADLNKRAGNGVSPTEIAIQNNHVDIAKYLIEHGVNVNETDKDGRGLLSQAIVTNSEDSVDFVKYLIEKGAKINRQSNDGWTPLHEAVQAGNKDMVQILLDHNAFVNAADTNGWTPLHEASRNGNLEISKLLEENGANIYAPVFRNFSSNNWSYQSGATPISIAQKHGFSNIVEYLNNKPSRFTSNRLAVHNK